MRYRGYAVTYVGETKRVNDENFFLNGICKENTDELFTFEKNSEFRSRNIYALASGAKCDAFGDELAYIVVDILRNFHVSNFDEVNREFFHVINTAVTSQVLDRSDEHYEVDASILSIDRDVATVYNMGDIPVLYFSDGKIENLSGDTPSVVEIEKDYHDERGEVQTKILEKKVVPHIGILDTDMEVVPYTSKSIKLKKKAYFVLCNNALLDTVGMEKIAEILGNEKISRREKALRIIDKAITTNPDENFSVEVIAVNRGLAIAEKELRSMGKWLIIAALCVGLCFNADFFMKQVATVANAIKGLVQKYTNDEVEENPLDDLRWIPLEERENAEKQAEQGQEQEPADSVSESDEEKKTMSEDVTENEQKNESNPESTTREASANTANANGQPQKNNAVATQRVQIGPMLPNASVTNAVSVGNNEALQAETERNEAQQQTETVPNEQAKAETQAVAATTNENKTDSTASSQAETKSQDTETKERELKSRSANKSSSEKNTSTQNAETKPADANTSSEKSSSGTKASADSKSSSSSSKQQTTKNESASKDTTKSEKADTASTTEKKASPSTANLGNNELPFVSD